MKVKVLFFAQLRDRLGLDEKDYDIREGLTVLDFTQILMREAGLKDLQRLTLAFSVNEEMVQGSHVLREGDTLALLPPVAGG